MTFRAIVTSGDISPAYDVGPLPDRPATLTPGGRLRVDAGTVTTTRTPDKLETTTRKLDDANGQSFTTSTTTARSSAITATEVAFSTDADGYFRFGTAGSVVATAGAGSMFVKAGGPYFWQITSGQALAFILTTGTGRVTLAPTV